MYILKYNMIHTGFSVYNSKFLSDILELNAKNSYETSFYAKWHIIDLKYVIISKISFLQYLDCFYVLNLLHIYCTLLIEETINKGIRDDEFIWI